MVVPDTTMDPHEYISEAIRQNNIIKLFYFVKSHFFNFFFTIIIYLFTNLLFCYVKNIYENSKLEQNIKLVKVIIYFQQFNILFYFIFVNINRSVEHNRIEQSRIEQNRLKQQPTVDQRNGLGCNIIDQFNLSNIDGIANQNINQQLYYYLFIAIQ